MTETGCIYWQGPSLIGNREEVVFILTFPGNPRDWNNKTGPMIQGYILPARREPRAALRWARNSSICGSCPLQGHFSRKLQKMVGRICYVRLDQGVRAVWSKYKRGGYPAYSWRDHDPIIGQHPVRLGAYGDPAAVPVSITRRLLRITAGGHTGYSHQILDGSLSRPRADKIAEFCMASTHDQETTDLAYSRGYRFFQAVGANDTPHHSAIECPHKRVSCANCQLCRGSGQSARSIWIYAHGAGAPNLQGAIS